MVSSCASGFAVTAAPPGAVKNRGGTAPGLDESVGRCGSTQDVFLCKIALRVDFYQNN